MSVSTTEKKLSNLHVRSFEEVMLLIGEAEKDYDSQTCISVEEAYYKGLEHIKNL